MLPFADHVLQTGCGCAKRMMSGSTSGAHSCVDFMLMASCCGRNVLRTEVLLPPKRGGDDVDKIWWGHVSVPRQHCGRPRQKLERVIAGRAYDSDPLRARLQARGIELVCPHRKSRHKSPSQDGRALRRYRKHWKVEPRSLGWAIFADLSCDTSVTCSRIKPPSASLAFSSPSGAYETTSSLLVRGGLYGLTGTHCTASATTWPSVPVVSTTTEAFVPNSKVPSGRPVVPVGMGFFSFTMVV